MAKHHMTYVFAFYLCASQRLAYHLRCQIGGGDVFQTAAKGSNGGTYCAYDYNFTGHGLFPLIRGVMGWALGANLGQCAA